MRAMASGFFADSPVLDFPIIALLLFLGVFIAITVRALRTPSVAFDRSAALPLEDEHHE